MHATHLALNNLCQANTFAIGNIEGNLLIEHTLVKIRLLTFKQATFGHGVTHGLEHHLDKDRLKLFGSTRQGFAIAIAGLGTHLLKTRKTVVDLLGWSLLTG